MPSDSKRRLLYNKRIAPHSFVFFFHKGPAETSWSVRDYSSAGSVSLRYAADFQDSGGRVPLAEEILGAAEYDFPAPLHPTSDLAHWHATIAAKNREYLGTIEAIARPNLPVAHTKGPAAVSKPSFPVVNLADLIASPKSRKRGDIERILHSPNSEDYVTWTFFQLLKSVDSRQWWPALLQLARIESIDPSDVPVIHLWRACVPPRGYEELSRERMRRSENPLWRERSLQSTPVEGASEIELRSRGASTWYL